MMIMHTEMMALFGWTPGWLNDDAMMLLITTLALMGVALFYIATQVMMATQTVVGWLQKRSCTNDEDAAD